MNGPGMSTLGACLFLLGWVGAILIVIYPLCIH